MCWLLPHATMAEIITYASRSDCHSSLTQVSNDATVAPIFQDANCGAMSVPPANEFGWAGTITCTYRVNLPNSGLAAGISHWPSVMATATINMSNAKCSSAVTQISTSWWAKLAQGLINHLEPSTAGTTPQGLTATAGATNAGRRLSQAAPTQVQTGQLGYVPTGCQGLIVTTNANQQQPNIVSGTVVLTNPGTIDIPIATVDVLLGNNIGMPPLHTTTCVGAVVPANPQPYTVGELVCTFSFTLPNNGPWIGVPQTPTWTIAKATATIAMSDSKCSSPVVTVMGTEPPVLGH